MELLVGMTVMAGVLSAAYLCLQAGLESQRLVETRADALQNARVALALLAADLRAACSLGEENDLVGMDRALGGAEADNLDFATHNYAPRGPGEGDLCEVSYYVDRSRETDGLGLWRRRDPSPDAEPFDGGSKEEIAGGLRFFRLEYSDGIKWYDSWGMRSQAERGSRSSALAFSNLHGLPEAVRVTIAFADPRPPAGARATVAAPVAAPAPPASAESRDAPVILQTIVFLNLADRVFSAAVGTGEGN